MRSRISAVPDLQGPRPVSGEGVGAISADPWIASPCSGTGGSGRCRRLPALQSSAFCAGPRSRRVHSHPVEPVPGCGPPARRMLAHLVDLLGRPAQWRPAAYTQNGLRDRTVSPVFHGSASWAPSDNVAVGSVRVTSDRRRPRARQPSLSGSRPLRTSTTRDPGPWARGRPGHWPTRPGARPPRRTGRGRRRPRGTWRPRRGGQVDTGPARCPRRASGLADQPRGDRLGRTLDEHPVSPAVTSSGTDSNVPGSVQVNPGAARESGCISRYESRKPASARAAETGQETRYRTSSRTASTAGVQSRWYGELKSPVRNTGMPSSASAGASSSC